MSSNASIFNIFILKRKNVEDMRKTVKMKIFLDL